MTTTAARAALSPRPALEVAPPIAGPVLLATDGTDGAQAAAYAARLVAGRADRPVEVVAVLQPLPAYSFGIEPPLIPPGFEVARAEMLRDAVLRQLEPVLGPTDRWRLELRYGPPGRTIAEVATERRAGIIVLGTGHHRLRDRLVGEEVSLQVVRHARCPVLAVDRRFRRLPHRAVVGVDFSAASVRAALTALALLDGGGDGGAQLVLVHARSPLEGTFPILGPWASEYDTRVGEHFARLLDLLRPHVPGGVAVQTRTHVGGMPETMLEDADQTRAQLVAVGTHGPGWVERLFVGSVATLTLRRAGRTVLVTPAPDARERVRLELGVFGECLLDRPEDWGGALDAFTRRNAGRSALLEVGDDNGPGTVRAAHDCRFVGATYDPHDARVEVMLALGGDGTTHLTHTTSDVRTLELVAEPGGAHDHSLVVEGRTGYSVLTLGGP